MPAAHGVQNNARRGSRGRGLVVGLCIVVALVHAARVVSIANDVPYIALLTAVTVVAAVGCAWQLARIDDAISWRCVAALGLILLGGYTTSLMFGLPGTDVHHFSSGVVVGVAISALLVVASASRALGARSN